AVACGCLPLELGQVLAADAKDVVGVGAHSLTSGAWSAPGVPSLSVTAAGPVPCCGRPSPSLPGAPCRPAEPVPRPRPWWAWHPAPRPGWRGGPAWGEDPGGRGGGGGGP